MKAYSNALRVAVEAAYPTAETLPLILSRAYLDARKVALEAAYPTPETLSELLSLAEMRAQTLQRLVEEHISS